MKTIDQTLDTIYENYPILKGLNNKELSELLFECMFIGDKDFGKAISELLKINEPRRNRLINMAR